MEQTEYNYESSGFGPFLTRPLGSERGIRNSTVKQVNFDQNQITGSLGDVFRVGKINLDGSNGRISIYDDQDREVVRIGELDD